MLPVSSGPFLTRSQRKCIGNDLSLPQHGDLQIVLKSLNALHLSVGTKGRLRDNMDSSKIHAIKAGGEIPAQNLFRRFR